MEKETQTKITDGNENLIQAGILDSFSMIRLLDFIDNGLHIKLDMENLSADNFNSLETIISTIKSHADKKD